MKEITQLRDKLNSLMADEVNSCGELIKAYGWDEHSVRCIWEEPAYDFGYSHGYANALNYVIHRLNEIEEV